MISTLIPLLSDSDQATILVQLKKVISSQLLSLFRLNLVSLEQVSWEALGRVIGSVPKEVLPSYIKLVRDAVSTARDKERRKRKVFQFDNFIVFLWPDTSYYLCMFFFV